MTDETNTDFTPATGEPASPRRRWWLALPVLAALGAAAWLWREETALRAQLAEQSAQLRQLGEDLNAVEVQADLLDTRQLDLATANQRAATQIAEFGGRIDGHDQIVGRLHEQVEGGRAHFQMAVVEQLLILANDRLQLAADVPSAITALAEADTRLAALRDPRLYPVREAISEELVALRAVPLPDLTGAALTLSSLVARAPRLPLAARVPDRFESVPESVPLPADARWYQRLGASVREALSNVFSVRRNTGPAPRLLAAEQEALVVQVLALKLEGARLAMLRGDAVSFRDLCNSAAQWLRDYFRADDPGVMAASAELERLAPLDLQPTLPDLTRSLALLRAQLRPETR